MKITLTTFKCPFCQAEVYTANDIYRGFVCCGGGVQMQVEEREVIDWKGTTLPKRIPVKL